MDGFRYGLARCRGGVPGADARWRHLLLGCGRYGIRHAPWCGDRAQRAADCRATQGGAIARRSCHGARRRSYDRGRVGGLRRRAARHDRHEQSDRGRQGGADGAHPGRYFLAQPGRVLAPSWHGLSLGAAQPDLVGGRLHQCRGHRRQFSAPWLQRGSGAGAAGGHAHRRHRGVLG